MKRMSVAVPVCGLLLLGALASILAISRSSRRGAALESDDTSRKSIGASPAGTGSASDLALKEGATASARLPEDKASAAGAKPSPEKKATRPNSSEVVSEGVVEKGKEAERALQLSWGDFYKQYANTKDSPTGDFEAVIIKRLRSELQLTADQAERLQRLITDEQVEVTKQLMRKYGSGEFINERLGDPNLADQFREELVGQREAIRRVRDAGFYEVFNVTQLALINEHLRNESLILQVNFGAGERNYLIRGIGK